MNTIHKILILLVGVIITYYIYNEIKNKQQHIELFQNKCSSTNIERISIQKQFIGKKLKCLLDYMDTTCKLSDNDKYPLSIIKTPDKDYLAVFNDGLLYRNSDIESQKIW